MCRLGDVERCCLKVDAAEMVQYPLSIGHDAALHQRTRH